MRKFLTAAALSLLLLGGQAQASTVESLDKPNVEVQEQGRWAHFRDKHILNRETENERRDREEWERRHRRDYYRDDYPPPPPPHRRHGPPPPHHRGYGPPPPHR